MLGSLEPHKSLWSLSMSPVSLNASDDTLTVGIDGQSLQLTTGQVDELIRRLAELRAGMKPVHPAEPSPEPARTFTGDNLLWCVRAAPQISALEVGIQHPGLGWIVVPLSRAQVEDFQTCLEFSLNDLPPVGPRATPAR
jgi:hypothetical protein